MAEQSSDKSPIAKIEIQILSHDVVKVFLNGKLFHIYDQCTVDQRKQVSQATEMKWLASGVQLPFGPFANTMDIHLSDTRIAGTIQEEKLDVSP